MKITICSSVDFTNKIKEVADALIKLWHEVEIPFCSKKIIAGELSLEEFLKVKESEGDGVFRRKATEDLIKRYYNLIRETDVILVLNYDKKWIKNYIWWNVFLEMGFAHVLNKKIYLLNDIPEMIYWDELKAMDPIVINWDLSQIK